MLKFTKPVNGFNICEFTHSVFVTIQQKNSTKLFQEYRKALDKYARDFIDAGKDSGKDSDKNEIKGNRDNNFDNHIKYVNIPKNKSNEFTVPVNEFNICESTYNIFLQIKEQNGTYLYQEYRKALDKFAKDYYEEHIKNKTN